MQLCALDQSPIFNARYHHNKDIRQLPLYIASVLCSSHRHFSEQSSINPELLKIYPLLAQEDVWMSWAVQSPANYLWLYATGMAFCEEFTHRFQKACAARPIISACAALPIVQRGTGMTDFPHPPATSRNPNVLDTEPVGAFRQFYQREYADQATWTPRTPPKWWFAEGINLRLSNF
jgi:hypothetical protein